MARDKGSYIEASVDTIDDGEFRQEFDEKLREAYRELEKYLVKTNSTKGKVKLTINLEIAQSGKEFASVDYSFGLARPKVKKTALIRAAGGRLLVNPEGDSLNDSDQMVMTFDRGGQPRAKVNLRTGEIADEPSDVAGKVGKSAG